MKKVLVILNLSLFLNACGGGSSGDSSSNEGSLGGSKYLLVSGSPSERSEDKVKGDASIVFKDPLGEIGSDKSYTLKFAIEDGGELRLVSHGDEKLVGGTSVIFARSQNTLSVYTSVGEKKSESKTLKNISANGAVGLVIDAHNSEAKTHVLVWGADEAKPSEDSALFNSETDAETPGKGKGKFWGLILTKAIVTSAVIGDVKFKH